MNQFTFYLESLSCFNVQYSTMIWVKQVYWKYTLKEFQSDGFDDVRNTWRVVLSQCIVTLNALTVTNENHKRCILPILPVNVPRSYRENRPKDINIRDSERGFFFWSTQASDIIHFSCNINIYTCTCIPSTYIIELMLWSVELIYPLYWTLFSGAYEVQYRWSRLFIDYNCVINSTTWFLLKNKTCEKIFFSK